MCQSQTKFLYYKYNNYNYKCNILNSTYLARLTELPNLDVI